MGCCFFVSVRAVSNQELNLSLSLQAVFPASAVINDDSVTYRALSRRVLTGTLAE